MSLFNFPSSSGSFQFLTHVLRGPRVTDIFFSYSSADRERVRPVRDALVAQGFEVFWDQEVPTGLDWDSWIRQHLSKCKCAMAFWSAASVASDNVRHEAVVAKQQGKLISILLESLTAQQFPMGLYAQQAANLADWNGDPNHKEWRKLRREYEAKLIPTWVRQQLDELEAELVGERARREGVERRDKTLQAQIAKEAETQLGLQRERDSALDEIAAAKANVVELSQRLDEANAQLSTSARRIKAAKDAARAALFTQNPIMQFGFIAAAVATLVFWTYHLVGSASPPTAGEQGSVQEAALLPVAVTDEARRKIEEAEQFKKEAERQTKAAAEVEAKLQVSQAEQQRQAKAAAEAQTKLQGAQAELQIQAKAAKDADTKRQAAEKAAADADAKWRETEAERQRLAAALKVEQEKPKLVRAGAPYEIRRNVMSTSGADFAFPVRSADECEQRCTQAFDCNVYSFKKSVPWCYLYNRRAEFQPNTDFDSGVRQTATPDQPSPAATNKLFEIRRDMEARSPTPSTSYFSAAEVRSIDECEQQCTRQSTSCNAFAFDKRSPLPGHRGNQCWLYSDAKLVPNTNFDSGVRQAAAPPANQSSPAR
jgi:hypothetical protein